MAKHVMSVFTIGVVIAIEPVFKFLNLLFVFFDFLELLLPLGFNPSLQSCHFLDKIFHLALVLHDYIVLAFYQIVRLLQLDSVAAQLAA